MDPSPLKERTYNFALQIIRFVQSLPRNRITPMFWTINCFVAEHPSAQITARLVEHGRKLTSLPKWASLRKKPMNPFIGWNCSHQPAL